MPSSSIARLGLRDSLHFPDQKMPIDRDRSNSDSVLPYTDWFPPHYYSNSAKILSKSQPCLDHTRQTNVSQWTVNTERGLLVKYNLELLQFPISERTLGGTMRSRRNSLYSGDIKITDANDIANVTTVEVESSENSANNVLHDTPSEVGRMSFLTVHSTGSSSSASSRRPSTAEVLIQRFQVEKVEGGGLSISGIGLAANCHILLVAFGFFFILVGIVLSYIGFTEKNQENDAEKENLGTEDGVTIKPKLSTVKNNETQRQLRIIGPVFIVVGVFMILVGLCLYGITRKVTFEEKERRVSEAKEELKQAEDSFATKKNNLSPFRPSRPSFHHLYPVLSVRRGSSWVEPTPVELPATPEDISSMQFGLSRSESPIPDKDNTSGIGQHPVSDQLEVSSGQQSKRGSHPFLNSYYGYYDGSTEVATFPPDDVVMPRVPGVVHEDEEETGVGDEDGESLKNDQTSNSNKISYAHNEESSENSVKLPRITVHNTS